MSQEAVRRATAEDLPALEALLHASALGSEVARAAALFRHPHRSQPALTRLSQALTSATTALFAGTLDDAVFGVGLVSLDTSAPAGVVGVIEELFVEPEARELGLGEALLEACVQWCVSEGCVGVDLATLPGDRNAKNLCERSGFLARTLVMHRNLR